MEFVYKFVTLDENGKFQEQMVNEYGIYNVPYTYTGGFESKWAREELQGQPVFSELVGPMYDGEENGKHVIRYESPRVNDILRG